MNHFIVLVCACLCALALATEPLVEIERLVSSSKSKETVEINGWKKLRRAVVSDAISVVFVMKRPPQALERLEQIFWQVSDPRDALYGQYMSSEEITTLVAAPPAHIDIVSKFIAKYDVLPQIGANKDLITIDVPAPVAERMFNTTLHVYAYDVNGQQAPRHIVRTSGSYFLPKHVEEVVELVGNLKQFPSLPEPQYQEYPPLDKQKEETARDDEWPLDCGACSQGTLSRRVSPEVLRQAYQLPLPPTKFVGDIAAAEFTQVFWDQEDLSAYASYCGLSNFTVDVMIGENKPKQCHVSILIKPDLCKEAILDITAIRAVAGTGIKLTNIYTKEYSLLSWAMQVGNLTDKPLVHSVSYGNDEAQQSSVSYMLSVNTEFMKLGAQGLTILFASGDGGVYGRRGSSKRYHPGFPAASPYITSIGGTDFTTKNVIGTETAWEGSGGGFSDTFSIPDYQSTAVSEYKTKAASTLPDQSKWNNTGRGFPDVSALGGNKNPYCVVLNNKASGAYGTSAATPVVAAAIALLNEQRLLSGKSPLGFVNPLFYQHPEAFHDVTTGSNGGTANKGGFSAIEGWDAATGLGTLNYDALSKVVNNIP